MNQTELLKQSIDLMLIGMGTVFSFLLLLVVLMLIISKLAADPHDKTNLATQPKLPNNEEIVVHKRIIRELMEQLS